MAVLVESLSNEKMVKSAEEVHKKNRVFPEKQVRLFYLKRWKSSYHFYYLTRKKHGFFMARPSTLVIFAIVSFSCFADDSCRESYAYSKRF
jgi:hypothetical protein